MNKLYVGLGISVYLLSAQFAVASVVVDSGCSMQAAFQTQRTVVVNSIECENPADINTIVITEGEILALADDDYETLVAQVGSSTLFSVPITHFSGSMGSDGVVYGGPYIYEYALATSVPTQRVSPEIEEKKALQLQIIELLRKIILLF